MRHIIFTVTNDLNFDQRMIRICSSLSRAGYQITLIGRKNSRSQPLTEQPFRQMRLRPWFQKGPGFYVEYNLRLFFNLLFHKADCICAIDLDTILPVYFAAKYRGCEKVYDAHEYFSEMKEVVSRPAIHKIWSRIERKMLPAFRDGYTVSKSIADVFKQKYGVNYALIRNLPQASATDAPKGLTEKIIIYQGAVNEARGFEFLVPAMKAVPAKLLVYGDGNFLRQAKELVHQMHLEQKIIFKGKFLPEQLNAITSQAYVGINLVENTGLNQYFSLANKFFDYIQYGVPQVTMNFPEYRAINEHYNVALLLDDLNPASIASALNRLFCEDELHAELKKNCRLAAAELNWEKEEKKLIKFYQELFG